MAEVCERLWYGICISIVYNILVLRYVHDIGVLWLFAACLATILIGDYLIAKLDKWLIKRKVYKEVVKAIKAQGLNPKDFDITFDNIRIAGTDGPDEDALKLKIKKKKKDDEAA